MLVVRSSPRCGQLARLSLEKDLLRARGREPQATLLCHPLISSHPISYVAGARGKELQATLQAWRMLWYQTMAEPRHPWSLLLMLNLTALGPTSSLTSPGPHHAAHPYRAPVHNLTFTRPIHALPSTLSHPHPPIHALPSTPSQPQVVLALEEEGQHGAPGA
jgi:hypothetical protein